MDYLLENLDATRFQELCQSLLVKEHPHTQCFPTSQADGGRDAIAYYQLDRNEKRFIVFQIKQVKHQPDLRKWVNDIVKKEAPKVNKLISKGAVQYYFLTNVRGSAHLDSGSIDQVNKIFSDEIEIPSICWWRDDLCRRLDNAWDLKWAYPEILTGTDMLHYILEAGLSAENRRLISIIKAFVQGQYIKDEAVRFKQGGLIQSKLTSLFIDVPINGNNLLDNRRLFHVLSRIVQMPPYIEGDDTVLFENYIVSSEIAYGFRKGEQTSLLGAARMLLHPIAQEKIPLIVLEGAPGQGKSTIVQYICQMHRMRLMNERFDKIPAYYRPSSSRIPIKIDLRDFATWLNGQDPFSSDEEKVKPGEWLKSLEAFLAHQITYDAGYIKFSTSDLQAIATFSSLLLVLDGFDEVADIAKREEIVTEVIACIRRLKVVAASLQVIITSRPVAFANSPGFPEKLFPHFQLSSLTIPQINDYAAKWVIAQELDTRDANDVKRVLKEKLNQPHMRDLARNPMQLAILLTLIHLRGSSLPDQRTALYDSYVERFFDRESDKNKIVHENRLLLINIHSYLAWILHSEAEQGQDRGSISTERLQRLLTDFFIKKELDIALVESISITTVERVFFLVSRVQGTFEFEVQPLREYFAARYLYKTAPHLPPGYVHPGTILDRFEAIAMNFYWFNVTRFYAGFYSEGELPSLVYQLQDLVHKDIYQYISYPRVLCANFLSDSIFSQHKRAMKDVLNVIFNELGIRYFWGNINRYPNTTVTSLILPKDCGRNELLKYCIDQLHQKYAGDYILLFTDLLKANSQSTELKELWLKETLGTFGKERTKWMRYGLSLGIFPYLNKIEIEQLLSDAPYDLERCLLLFRVLPLEKIEMENIGDFKQYYDMYMYETLSYSSSSSIRRRVKSLLELFSQAININRYTLALQNPSPEPLVELWKQKDISPIDDRKDLLINSSLPSEEIVKIEKILDIIQVEQCKSAKDWATELTSWDQIVENCRSIWGEQWLFFRFANVASGIKSNTETYKDFPDLLDKSKSLCKRTRYARLRAGAVDWWNKQLNASKDDQELMFTLLVLLTWGSPSTITTLAELIDRKLNQLSTSSWHYIHRSLKHAVSLLNSTETRRSIFDVEKIPEILSEKTFTMIGIRAREDEGIKIYQKYLVEYRGSDANVLQFCQTMALNSIKANPNSWQESLAIVAHSYAHDVISDTMLSNHRAWHESLSLPSEAMIEIAQHPERYPRNLVLLIEKFFKEAINSNIIPVGKIAKEQHWFDD